jgi:hypothetical protein
VPCTMHGRCGRRGGSPKREKKTCGATMTYRRERRRELAKFCQRWHNCQKPGSKARIPASIIEQLKVDAGLSVTV